MILSDSTGYRDRDANGWYFKARTFKDPLTGKWTQATRRGFATATEAAKARQRVLDQASTGLQAASETGDVLSHCRHTTWNEVKAVPRSRDERHAPEQSPESRS